MGIFAGAACLLMGLCGAPGLTQGSTLSALYVYSGGTYGNSGLSTISTGNVTVTAILDSSTTTTFVAQDSTGGAIVYHYSKTGYAAPMPGDVITLNDLTNSAYQGEPELVNSGSISLVSTPNPAPLPDVVTAVQFNAGQDGSGYPLPETYVELMNVTFPNGTSSLSQNTSYTMTDNTGTFTMYTYKSYSNTLAAINYANAHPSLFSGPVNITGYVDDYYGAPELYPLTFSQAPEPASVAMIGIATAGLVRRRRR